MLRVLVRKLALMMILLPVLHAGGYLYALHYQPDPLVRYRPGQVVTVPEDPPFWPSYRAYWESVRQGDLGRIQRTPLTRILPDFLRYSLALAGAALLVSIVLGPLVGMLSISRQSGRITPSAVTIFTLGTAIPGFFLGTTLIVMLLALTRRGWFGITTELPIPVQGTGIDGHLILPVLALSIRPVMYVGYVIAGLLEHEFQQDYIRVARSKGLHWRTIVRRHALPNIASPALAALGRALQMIVGAIVLVETLFDWRGAGWLFSKTLLVSTNAYYGQPGLVSLLLVFFGAQLMLIDLVASIMAVAADPRLRHSASSA